MTAVETDRSRFVVEPLSEEAARAVYADKFEKLGSVYGGYFPNSLRILARDPELTRALVDLGELVLQRPGKVELELKWLVASISSRAAGCRYCQTHTANHAFDDGVALERIEALWHFESSPLFSDAERSALRFAVAAAQQPNCVTRETFDDLHEHYDDDQIVEIAAVVAYFGYFNRWNDTFSVPLENSPLQFGLSHLAASGWEPIGTLDGLRHTMSATLRVSERPGSGANLEPAVDVPVRIVDTDVHPMLESPAQLKQWLPARWHQIVRHHCFTPIKISAINDGTRVDARPADGRPAGSDPHLMKRQLLDEAGVDIAIFTYHTMGNLPNPEADAAMTSAINEWQSELWLGEYNGHGRYRGSIRVPAHNPEAAIREIHRWADDDRFVQVLLVHPYQPAFGHPMYEPIWAAAAECGLPVAVHVSVGQLGAIQFMSLSGHPAYMFEWHTGSYPAAYAAHVASLVCSGIFERIPSLKFVMAEGGIAWSLPLGNHLDRNWRLLKSEVPHLRERPSEYLRRNVLFTTQPVEESYSDDDSVLDVWQELGAESRLMFSSDYPHWDFDDPKLALPRMDAQLRTRILAGTALELYGLPSHRPAEQ